MTKNIMKELIIILLLLLAIILVLAVFLYDYIPTNKIVPKIEQYEAPNSVKEELSAEVNDTEENSSPIVYEINSSDLNIYEKAKDYEKGKANPFESDEVEENTINNINGSNTTNGTNSGATNSNSVGNYLPSTGTK